jgi:transposase
MTSRVDSGRTQVAHKLSKGAGRQTHPCATTTPKVRRAIQASEENNIVLAKRFGANRKTIAKWKARDSVSDERMGPRNPRPRLLTEKDEAIILAYRWRTRLPLNDCLVRLQRFMPKLNRSTLSRCLKRYGLGRVGKTATAPPLTCETLMRGPYRFEITANTVVFPAEVIGVAYQLFLAVEEVTKQVYAEVVPPGPENAAAFLARLVAEFPQKIVAVTTDVRPMFTDGRWLPGEDMLKVGSHPFAVACRAYRIAHAPMIPPCKDPPKIRTLRVEIR